MTGAGGSTPGMGMTQAAHLAGWVLLPGPSRSAAPIWIVCGPSLEQMTMGWPGVAAAMAPNGRSAPKVMANTAARKATERLIDQESVRERVTVRL